MMTGLGDCLSTLLRGRCRGFQSPTATHKDNTFFFFALSLSFPEKRKRHSRSEGSSPLSARLRRQILPCSAWQKVIANKKDLEVTANPLTFAAAPESIAHYTFVPKVVCRDGGKPPFPDPFPREAREATAPGGSGQT